MAAKRATEKAKPRGRGRPKSGLTGARIRDAALALIEREGLEGFSTRKLGAALGCEAMAIYWYFPSKDALLDAVVDDLIARVSPSPGAAATDWIDALRALAHAYRGLAHAYPRAFPLLATRRFATEGTYRFLDDLFELARRQGLDDHTTARFFRLVSSYCSGVALDELAGLRETSALDDEEARAAFPRLVAVSRFLTPAHFDEVFEFGLELLLDALERADRGTQKDTKPRATRRR